MRLVKEQIQKGATDPAALARAKEIMQEAVNSSIKMNGIRDRIKRGSND